VGAERELTCFENMLGHSLRKHAIRVMSCPAQRSSLCHVRFKIQDLKLAGDSQIDSKFKIVAYARNILNLEF
jgi:hypothetical protein